MRKTILFIPVYLSLTFACAQELPDSPEVAPDAAVTSATTDIRKTIAIQPATLYMNAGPGESQEQNIYIDNQLDSPVIFRLSFSDFDRDENGNPEYFAPGTTSNTCAQWLKLQNNTITVAPGEQGTVPIKLELPDSAGAADGMKWAMIFLEGLTEKVKESQSGDVNTSIETSYRIAVQVYQTPPNIMKKELRMLSFVPGEKRGEYSVKCKNEGNTLIRCSAHIELVSAVTAEKITIYPEIDGKNAFKLLPGQLRNVDFKVGAYVPKGKYTAIAMLDANDDDVPIEAAQLEIELK